MRIAPRAVVIAAAVVAAVVVAPSGAPRAQPAADVERAKDLYKSAEAAMREARHGDAIRDYGAAYELTRDPVLFFKIASANEKAGNCEVALIYYRRYLKDAAPTEQHATLTRQRIVACGGDPASGAPLPPAPPAPPAGGGDTGKAGAGSAGAGSGGAGSGTAAADRGAVAADRGSAGAGSGIAAADRGTTAADRGTAGSGTAAADRGPAGSGTAAADRGSAGAPAAPANLGVSHRTSWLLAGGSLTMLTIGAVLAYSANAAESDVNDLYVGLAGVPPEFDARTAARYQELLDEGNRYEKLSWLSFGVAGALAAGAVVKYLLDDPSPAAAEAPPRAVRITPTVTPGGGGVSATVRF